MKEVAHELGRDGQIQGAAVEFVASRGSDTESCAEDEMQDVVDNGLDIYYEPSIKERKVEETP